MKTVSVSGFDKKQPQAGGSRQAGRQVAGSRQAGRQAGRWQQAGNGVWELAVINPQMSIAASDDILAQQS